MQKYFLNSVELDKEKDCEFLVFSSKTELYPALSNHDNKNTNEYIKIIRDSKLSNWLCNA